MPRILYEDFNLLIECTEAGRSYCAIVQGSPGGDARQEFLFEDLQLRRGAPLDRTKSMEDFPPRTGVPTFSDAVQFGERLFNAIFRNDLLIAWETSLTRVESQAKRLRLRLNLSATPELAVLPWEYLRHPKKEHFYAQFGATPIIRYLEQLSSIEPLRVKLPLRILVMAPSPAGYPKLDVEGEWNRLREALDPLLQRKQIELELVEPATRSGLRSRLLTRFLNQAFHVFHFIGHGCFDEDKNEGFLLLERNKETTSIPSSEDEADWVSGHDIGTLLRNHDTFRLAIVNACEGARISNCNSYVGTAQRLLQHGGIPAVVAMQFEISDRHAVEFSQAFYTAIVNGYPVEAALSEARLAIYSGDKSVEWGTPVLYMRSNSGQIFNLANPKAQSVQSNTKTKSLSGELTDVHKKPAHYEVLSKALDTGQLVIFLGLDVNLFGREIFDNFKPGKFLPGYLELARYLAKEVAYPAELPVDLEYIAQFASVRVKESELNLILNRIFSPPHELNKLYRFISKLVKRNRDLSEQAGDDLRNRFVVVTTTYDHLIEEAFANAVTSFHILGYVGRGRQSGKFQHITVINKRPGQPVIIDNPIEYPGLLNEEPIILKLPGTVENDFLNYVITEDEYFTLANKELAKLLPPQVLGKLRQSRHLYLGYSPRHWPLRALLYSIWENRRSSSKAWAVLLKGEELDKDYWEQCGVEVVQEALEDYIAGWDKVLFGS